MTEQQAANKAAYERADAARDYANLLLLPSEFVILARFSHEIQGRPILDLACGGGRTTFYLRRLTSRYVGIDLSTRMTEIARKRFGERHVDIQTGDMRDLRRFEDGTFGLVMISANGIDHLSYEDRNTLLVDIRRVLAADGLFVFSAHNLLFLDQRWDGKIPLPSWRTVYNPKRWLRNPSAQRKRLTHTLRSHRNYASLEHLQHRGERYAVVVGMAHDHSVVTLWIDPVQQIEDLKEAGFSVLHCFDTFEGTGETVAPAESCEHSALYYVCRNTGGPGSGRDA